MKKLNHNNGPLAALRRHVSGAIERGEKQAIAGLTSENLVAVAPEKQGVACDEFAAIAKANGGAP